MARPDLLLTDASEKERSSLEYLLKKEREKKDVARYVPVGEAMRGEAVFETQSDRDVTRVLFISKDESLLNPTQQSLDGYTNIADLFDEVHILILRQGIPSKSPVLRVDENVWLYTATERSWWGTIFAGRSLTKDQLVFAEGFRPDLIVARDPFESGFLAWWLGLKFNRPVQVHVLDNFYAEEFKSANKSNSWRVWLAKFVLSKVKSVRTNTKALLSLINKKHAVTDLAVLPRLNNYEALMELETTLDLKEKYKPFVFIILYVGKLDFESTFHRALDASRFGLRNPRVGLIALGKGKAEKEYKRRAKILEIDKQVVFEPNVKDIVPYLKSANVLIVTDTTPESEELVLQGAAAGIPLLLARTPIREDIFSDGENALLCDPTSTDEFSLRLNILMNDFVLRRQLVEGAQDMIKIRFHEDPREYQHTYRESIEQVLFLADIEAESEAKPKTVIEEVK